jgi:hypothetical protein
MGTDTAGRRNDPSPTLTNGRTESTTLGWSEDGYRVPGNELPRKSPRRNHLQPCCLFGNTATHEHLANPLVWDRLLSWQSSEVRGSPLPLASESSGSSLLPARYPHATRTLTARACELGVGETCRYCAGGSIDVMWVSQ